MALSYKNDEKQDERLSPYSNEHARSNVDNARELSALENDAFGDIVDNFDKTADDKRENSNIADAKEKERSGSWVNKTTGAISGKTSKKKKGPVALLITIFFGGALGIGGLFGGPGLLIVNLSEVMTSKFNTQMGSMETRNAKVLSAKVASNTTSGLCSTGISIKCKYASLSDKQVAKLKAAGIEVTSDSTTRITGRVKPTSLSYVDSKGVLQDIPAKDFPRAYASNATLRSGMKKAYNSKFAGFSDSIFSKVAGKLKISKKAPFDGATTDEERTKAVQNATKNGTSADSAKKLDPNKDNKKPDGKTSYTPAEIKAHNDAIDTAGPIGDEAKNIAKTGVKAGSKALLSGATSIINVTGIQDNACSVYGLMNAVSVGAKTIRAAQMARYAMVFLTTASMIKAGTATPEDVSYIGNTLTKTTKDNPKSATDSDGYQYAADTRTGPIGESATQYLSGGGLGGELSLVTAAIAQAIPGGQKQIRSTCGVLRNPFVQIGSFVAGIALMIIPGGQAVAFGKIATQATFGIIITGAMILLPAMLADMAAGVLVDSTTAGEDSGNAIASGSGAMMGSLAAAGGNAPLKPEQAVAYNSNVQQTVLAQISEEDALNYSPLDATNANTAMGKIATKLIPYTSNMSSLSGILTGTVGIVGSTVGNILTPSASAVGSASDYTQCQDVDYRELNVATDPFCNPIYGIPSEYLQDDPNDINDRLIGAGQIDEQTGAPIAGSTYATFVKDCIDRERPLGDSGEDFQGETGEKCFINDSNADYYVHHIDQRVLDGMENGYEGLLDGRDGQGSDTNDPGLNSGIPINDGGWSWPAALDVNITTGWMGYSGHTGVDMNMGVDQPIYAMRDGVIKMRNNLITSGWCPSFVPAERFGTMQTDLLVSHNVNGQQFTSVYAHLNTFTKKEGDTVKAGDLIGYSGSKGCSSGPHVHIGLQDSAGTFINPEPYMRR